MHAGTTLLVTMGGLKINENQQVIDADAHPIEGLWAAGNCSGSFFFGDYPITISGASHGRACTGWPPRRPVRRRPRPGGVAARRRVVRTMARCFRLN